MDINDLKKLIKDSTAVLVLDNGEPAFVVIDYKTYKDIASERGEEKEIKINPIRSNPPIGPSDRVSADETSNEINQAVERSGFNGYNIHEKESEILERLNKEILALKNQIEMEEKGITNPHIDPSPFER